MCKRQVEIYEQDAKYLDKLKDKFKLISKAAVLELIIKSFKKHLSEDELR